MLIIQCNICGLKGTANGSFDPETNATEFEGDINLECDHGGDVTIIEEIDKDIEDVP